MVHIHRSNRLDTLVTLLGDVVAEPLSNPYAKETIVVSSLGMERWLIAELSRRFGVWTNAEHPLPRAFVERILLALSPEQTAFDVWDREHLVLGIARLLSEEEKSRLWPTLHKYVEGSTRLERVLELSHQIADAFDQYLVYRPDWIEAWQSGATASAPVESWQPELFMALVRELGPDHFARRLQSAKQALREKTSTFHALPERVCCFQVGLLPPSYLQLLQGLSHHVPTHLFLLSPSRVYVESLRNNAHGGGNPETTRSPSADAWHQQSLFGATNETWQKQPLFASLCRQARQLEAILGQLGGTQNGQEHFIEPVPTTLLELVQSDIGALRHRPLDQSQALYELSPADRSISIHACHSRRREIECLRENLIDQFERDPSLSPEDVLVMLADIEEYAPLVDATFAVNTGEAGFIPYTIADRSAISFNGLADSLLRLLDLFAQRLTFSRVMELLSLERLSLKFEILPNRLPLIEKWLTRLRFVWGLDGVDRESAGATATEEHTLRFGLSRLLLGVALDSSVTPVYGGRAPFDLEGDEAELAGRFVELCDTCFEFRAQLTREQSMASYTESIARLIDEVFVIDRDSEWQRTEIRVRLTELTRVAQEARFEEKITFHSFRRELASRLEVMPSARSFLSGGVTFCKMLPLRSIPFRVIAMVGLDDGQFPRRDRRLSFNGLHREPRLGDRRVSDEDRFLFAETLLACRERLVITYVGRSSRDDSALPPSVVVEELLNTIEESCKVSGEGSIRERVLHVEALQPFSPRYFDGSHRDLVCRSPWHYRSALAVISPRQARTTPNYSLRTLPTLDHLRLSDLASLLRKPSQVYLDFTLHAARDLEFEARDGTEPVVLDGLAQWQVTRAIVEARRQGEALPSIKERLQASGELPILALGDLSFELSSRRAESLLSAAEAYGTFDPLEEYWLSIDVDGIRIEGWLESTSPTAHLYLSPSQLSDAHVIQAWLEHLCLNASGRALPTAIVMRADEGSSIDTRILQPLGPTLALHLLRQLLQDYREALTLPLPFWVEPAFAYCRARNKHGDHLLALSRASDELERLQSDGKLNTQFESLYGDDPISDDWPARAQVPELRPFAELALRWVAPILESMHDPRDRDSSGTHPEGKT